MEGLGFILVEIGLIHRYTLLLGRPLVAFAAIVGSLLVFGGLGSLCAHAASRRGWLPTAAVSAAVALGIAARAILLPEPLRLAMQWEFAWRVVWTVLTIAPLGILMGMALPLGMSVLGRTAPEAVPWAQGVNGCMSVMATVVATAVSIFFGITATLLVAALAYVVSAVSLRSRGSAPSVPARG
jgi:predicted membrane-bound spermidine synthase